MRRIISAGLLVLLGTGLVLAAAPEPAPRPAKVGYVDITRALNDYQRRAALEKELRDLHLSLTSRDNVRAADLKRMEQEIEQLAMGTPERLALEQKHKTAVQDAEKFRRETFEELNRRFIAMISLLHKEILDETAAVAREGQFDLVIKDQTPEEAPIGRAEAVLQISQRVVLYAKPEYDLTATVVERLNRKYAAEPQKTDAPKDKKGAAGDEKKPAVAPKK
jgi:Skp family chaperone for outer membrane proteins